MVMVGDPTHYCSMIDSLFLSRTRVSALCALYVGVTLSSPLLETCPAILKLVLLTSSGSVSFLSSMSRWGSGHGEQWNNWVYWGPAAVLYVIPALWMNTYPDWAVEAGHWRFIARPRKMRLAILLACCGPHSPSLLRLCCHLAYRTFKAR